MTIHWNNGQNSIKKKSYTHRTHHQMKTYTLQTIVSPLFVHVHSSPFGSFHFPLKHLHCESNSKYVHRKCCRWWHEHANYVHLKSNHLAEISYALWLFQHAHPCFWKWTKNDSTAESHKRVFAFNFDSLNWRIIQCIFISLAFVHYTKSILHINHRNEMNESKSFAIGFVFIHENLLHNCSFDAYYISTAFWYVKLVERISIIENACDLT